MDSKKIDI